MSIFDFMKRGRTDKDVKESTSKKTQVETKKVAVEPKKVATKKPVEEIKGAKTTTGGTKQTKSINEIIAEDVAKQKAKVATKSVQSAKTSAVEPKKIVKKVAKDVKLASF